MTGPKHLTSQDRSAAHQFLHAVFEKDRMKRHPWTRPASPEAHLSGHVLANACENEHVFAKITIADACRALQMLAKNEHVFAKIAIAGTHDQSCSSV